MAHKIFLLLVLMVTLFVSRAHAQFEYGHAYFGVHSGPTGVGAIGDQVGFGQGIALGLDVEAGVGRVGLGGLVDYYSYRDDYGYTKKFVDFLIPIQYHIEVCNSRWDPFLGFFIGYLAEDYYGKFADLGVGSSPKVGLSGGARYFFNDNWAVQARLGAGFGYYLLALGIDYKL